MRERTLRQSARACTKRFPMHTQTKSFSVLLFLRGYLALLRMESLLAGRGFAALHRVVKELPVEHNPADARTEETLCRAVDLACVFYFKQVLCLQRAAATTWLLRRSGIPAEMVIGVQQCPFRAHAWVEVAGRVVNDKPYTSELYTVIDKC